MTLDDKGREGVVAFLQKQGYTGTLEQWWDEVSRQSYLSEVRMGKDIWVPSLGHKYRAAQEFVIKLMDSLAPRFDAINVSANWNLDFHFYDKAARRPEAPSRPLRLSGMALTIERRDDYVNVRIMAYVDTEFRRDWNVRFLPGKKGQGISREYLRGLHTPQGVSE